VYRETLIELLEDLRHDLGKHLVLPLRLLPADADDAAVRAAARTALLRTRRGPDGATDAEALWAGLRRELVDALGAPLTASGADWAALHAAVERALGWRARLDDPTLDRAAITADLAAVAGAVDRVLLSIGPGEDADVEDAP